jgi:gliding motility-associated-like protein
MSIDQSIQVVTARRVILWLLLLTGMCGYSQLSKTHYIPPLTNSETGNANPEAQYLYLSTPSETAVPYTIQLVGQPASAEITGSVSNEDPQEIFLGTDYGQLFVRSSVTSRATSDKGYIIEAEKPVYASVRMQAGNAAQAGALVSKGLSGLDTSFRIGAYTNANPQTNYLNFASIMATEDDTQVTISDLPAGLIIRNFNGSTPVSISLNRGESYTIATNAAASTINRDGLIGGLIESSKPVVVNTGSANGSFHNGGGRDYGIDQIAGASKIGNEYIFVRGDGNDGWENILIVAHSNGTGISINGAGVIATINAGEYFVIEGDQYSGNNNMYVETTADVFAYQGVGGLAGNEANQGMFFVPPLSCEARGNLDNIANITRIGNTVYSGDVTIVANEDATVTINNRPISDFATVGPLTVTGNPDYVTYRVSNLTGDVSVQSSGELYCAYFNVNGAATSGSFYSGFPSAPEINFEAEFSTLGNCIPNVTLSAANTEVFDSFAWLYDDGSGFVDTGVTTASFKPTLPGRYKLRGEIICSGLVLESVEVPVSLCPDDIDNDGIIDNIDIDNDNDGILNCTESRGNVNLDMSSITAPVLIFQDMSSNTMIASATYNEAANSSTFTGDDQGNFTSTVNAGTDVTAVYSLNFTEPVNIQVDENPGESSTTVDDEFFVMRVLPASKNITLVNLDNRLLVDTDFDGIFESRVERISGSEIRFQINPTPSGTRPYYLRASQVDGVQLEHHLDNVTNPSIYSATLSLTCFKIDTDNDGVIDSLDLDSDNDGIPDSTENQGSNVVLSNVDTNFDGLDDVFDVNASPIDTDGDGVMDFYDLDSDNDGIHDVRESGSGLSDTNFDGVIDNVASNIGGNGWDNNAESSPDSGELGFTVRDLDNDDVLDYIDLDSDGDTCFDVIEAGFTDSNGNGRLAGANIIVNDDGLVTNGVDGYTAPNDDYITSAPILIDLQPSDTAVCEESDTEILIDANAQQYQWELSDDDGVNWNIIIDNSNYTGAQTARLQIVNAPLTLNNYQYRVRLDRDGNTCGLVSNVAILTVNPLPVINSPVELIQCDDDVDGISLFNLTEANQEIANASSSLTFTYYLSQTAAEAGDSNDPEFIDTPTAYENTSSPFSDTVWARITTSSGCARVAQLNLLVGTSQIPAGAVDETFEECDDNLDLNGNDTIDNDDTDGIASFDFSTVKTQVENFFLPQTPDVTFYRNETDALTEQNEIIDIANYRNIGYPGGQQIYIRVDSQVSNDCQAFGPFINLIVNPLPEFTIENEQTVCATGNLRTIELEPMEANPNEVFNYRWTRGSDQLSTDRILQVSEAGTYTITLTKTDGTSCSRSRDVIVNASELPDINANDIIVVDLQDNNTVAIENPETLGLGNYVYTLRPIDSSGDFATQRSPIFTAVPAGFYNLIIEDLDGCGNLTIPVTVIGYPKFFTPNNDGFNDRWRLQGINGLIQSESIIYIFDRYGKLLKQLDPASAGWDGTFNGKPLPSSDYWFKVELQDGRTLSGNFSLKR